MNKGKFAYIFLMTGLSLIVTNCSPPPLPPPGDYVSFRITGFSCSASDGFKFDSLTNSINMFEFKFNSAFGNPFYPYNFTLSEVVTSSSDGLVLRELNPTRVYTYEITIKGTDGQRASTINLYDYYQSRFFHKSGNTEIDVFKFDSNLAYTDSNFSHNLKDLTIRAGTTSDISLTYDFTGESLADINVNFGTENEKYVLSHNGTKLFNYNAHWFDLENPYEYNANKYNAALNIVFMADGFTENNLLSYSYAVRDKVNDLRNNKFFNEHWDKINFVLMETISLDNSGHYNIIGANYNPYAPENILGDGDRIRKLIRTSFLEGPLSISAENNTSNIDVIVIIKKDSNLAYTQTYGGGIATKNGQPVNIIVMPDKMLDGSLAHLMGHALARLQDESPGACNFGSTGMVYTYGYENYFRNIDIDSGRLKWGNFIDPHGFIYGMSDAIFAYLYSNVTPHRIPTEHSIMRAKYVNGFTAYGRQFGPVNRYHMEASFRIRTGIISGEDDDKRDKTTDLNYGMRDSNTWQIVEDYEWVGYKIPDFKKEYSPEYFLFD